MASILLLFVLHAGEDSGALFNDDAICCFQLSILAQNLPHGFRKMDFADARDAITKAMRTIAFLLVWSTATILLSFSSARAVTIYTEQNLVPEVLASIFGETNLKFTARRGEWHASYDANGDQEAALHDNSVASVPLSIIPLVVSIVETPINERSLDFVLTNGAASEPAIFIFSRWKNSIAPAKRNSRLAQTQSLLDAVPISRTAAPEVHSILLVIAGILLIVAARHQLKR